MRALVSLILYFFPGLAIWVLILGFCQVVQNLHTTPNLLFESVWVSVFVKIVFYFGTLIT